MPHLFIVSDASSIHRTWCLIYSSSVMPHLFIVSDASSIHRKWCLIYSSTTRTANCRMRHVTHQWRSHVTHMNESCHIYKGVTSHLNLLIRKSCHALTSRVVLMNGHFTRINESRHTCMNESCHTSKEVQQWQSLINQWVMSHVKRGITMNEWAHVTRQERYNSERMSHVTCHKGYIRDNITSMNEPCLPSKEVHQWQ
jgi:hypothetical protein